MTRSQYIVWTYSPEKAYIGICKVVRTRSELFDQSWKARIDMIVEDYMSMKKEGRP